jgi:hypothetical protein
MAHDVFVSHSVKDNAVADAVVARLEAESVSCWIAPRDVVPGADWGESIIDAIESSRIMILIFSRSADASSQIKREVERAVNKGVYIIPFRVDDIPPTRALEYFISTSQWMDAFSPPLERHLDNLAKTVKVVLKSPPLPGANVPVQPERPSIPIPRTRPPSSRKSILIRVAIAILVIVAAAGWYLSHPRGKPQRKMSDMEWDTDRLGADYTAFTLPTDNPKQCEDACRSDEKCRSWTYVKPNTIRGPKPMCYLKSAIPPRQDNPSCVSGTKGQ